MWTLLVLILFIITIPNTYSNGSFHGGTFLALTGKDSIVMATDSRYTHHRMSSLLLGIYPRNIYRIGFHTLLGCFGLDSDIELLIQSLKEKLGDHRNDELYTEHIARGLSSTLYDKRYLLSPILAGINKDKKPYLCSMDSLGASTVSSTYVVVGTAANQLQGICESLYIPDLSSEDLIGLTERCLQLALQRDILSGGDVKIVLMCGDEFYLKTIRLEDV
jgi:20S proteasome subunit beta 3